MKKQHFVFDLDDTLIDGRLFCGETIARAIKTLKPDVNEEIIINFHEALRGLAIPDIYSKILIELNLKLDINKLLAIDAKIQKAEIHRINCFDGVIDVLEYLKSKGKLLHISTNRKLETLIPILKHIKINDYFETITSCIDKGYKKPDGQCLTQLISQYDNNKDAFIYFGDSEIDFQFAKNAGVDCIIFDQYLNNKNFFRKLINSFLDDIEVNTK